MADYNRCDQSIDCSVNKLNEEVVADRSAAGVAYYVFLKVEVNFYVSINSGIERFTTDKHLNLNLCDLTVVQLVSLNVNNYVHLITVKSLVN